MGDGQLRLLDQVRDRIRRKHNSIRTEQAYVSWVRRFVLHHNKSGRLDRGLENLSRYGGVSLGFGFASSRPTPVRR